MTHIYEAVEPARAEIDARAAPLVLEFGAPWCGYCRAAQPLMRGRFRSEVGHKTYWSSQAFLEAVRSWIADPAANHGFLLQADDVPWNRSPELNLVVTYDGVAHDLSQAAAEPERKLALECRVERHCAVGPI